MIDFLRANKKTAIVVAIVLLGVLGYVLFFGGDNGGALVATTPVAENVGRDLLATLLQLKSLDLDETLFQNPIFQSLRDFGVPIPPQPLGRPNPFAPLGSTTPGSR